MNQTKKISKSTVASHWILKKYIIQYSVLEMSFLLRILDNEQLVMNP
jgi:hypothetical protein